MATREEKNTITNIYRLRSLEELENNPNTSLYGKNEGGKIFIHKCLRDIIYDTQPPVDLWYGLWHQGEMACLFGEPNIGKTILAMKIASDIIKRDERVLYFDFENAEHQLLPRYQAKDDSGNNAPLIDILTLNHANYQIKHDNHSMLDYIKRAFLLHQAHIIIIDDISHLFGSGNQADVRFVLNTLRSWTKQFRVSILVLAHSKKKGTNQLANIEQLAGSFECAYSFDSIFSLNRANDYNKSNNGISHYIKHHKTRMGEIVYGERNVITLNLKFDDELQVLTMCDLACGANERQLVRDFGYYTDDQVVNAIFKFKKLFYSIREIADLVGVSKSKVGRILKDGHKPQEPPTVEKIKIMPLPPMTTEPINPHKISPHNFLNRGEEAFLYDDDKNPNILGNLPSYYPIE